MIEKFSEEEKKQLLKQIQTFKKLTWPDDILVRKIMERLGIYDIVDLDFTLNSRNKRERNAAMKMIERYLPDLMSGNPDKWADAKDSLKQIYFQVQEVDEEAYL